MKSKWQVVQSIVVIVSLAVAGIVWFNRNSELGQRYAVSDKEAVNYSGDATEAQAITLAGALTENGFFDGQSEKDVLLKIKGEQKTVSFVVQEGKWEDSHIQKTFEKIGESIAPALGGLPLTIRLIDDRLVRKHEIPISSQRFVVNHSDQEFVILRTKAMDDSGKELGDILQKVGYFDGTAPATVLLDKSSGATVIGFVVQEGKAQEEAVVKYYTGLIAEIAPLLGNVPLTIQLLDSSYDPVNSWDHPAP